MIFNLDINSSSESNAPCVVVLEGAKLIRGSVAGIIALSSDEFIEGQTVKLVNDDGEIFAVGTVDVAYEEVFEDISEDDLKSLSYPSLDSTHDLFDLLRDSDVGFRSDDSVVLMWVDIKSIESTEVYMDRGYLEDDDVEEDNETDDLGEAFFHDYQVDSDSGSKNITINIVF